MASPALKSSRSASFVHNLETAIMELTQDDGDETLHSAHAQTVAGHDGLATISDAPTHDSNSTSRLDSRDVDEADAMAAALSASLSAVEVDLEDGLLVEAPADIVRQQTELLEAIEARPRHDGSSVAGQALRRKSTDSLIDIHDQCEDLVSSKDSGDEEATSHASAETKQASAKKKRKKTKTKSTSTASSASSASHDETNGMSNNDKSKNKTKGKGKSKKRTGKEENNLSSPQAASKASQKGASEMETLVSHLDNMDHSGHAPSGEDKDKDKDTSFKLQCAANSVRKGSPRPRHTIAEVSASARRKKEQQKPRRAKSQRQARPRQSSDASTDPLQTTSQDNAQNAVAPRGAPSQVGAFRLGPRTSQAEDDNSQLDEEFDNLIDDEDTILPQQNVSDSIVQEPTPTLDAVSTNDLVQAIRDEILGATIVPVAVPASQGSSARHGTAPTDDAQVADSDDDDDIENVRIRTDKMEQSTNRGRESAILSNDVWFKRVIMIVLFIIVLMLVGVVVALVAVFADGGGGGGTNNPNGPQRTAVPKEVSPTAAPTSFAETYLTAEQQALFDSLRSAVDPPMDSILTIDSPQFRALDYLCPASSPPSPTANSNVSFCTNHTTSPSVVSQAYALLTFYFGAVNATQPTSLLSDPICTWPGVASCSESHDPTVTAFDYSNSNLIGTIPDEMALLEHLEVFNVSSNRLSGTLPGRFGSDWVNMTIFDVSDNDLTGIVPSQFSDWAHVDAIHLHNNALTGYVPPPVCVHRDNMGFDLSADCANDGGTISCPCCSVCCGTNVGCAPHLV